MHYKNTRHKLCKFLTWVHQNSPCFLFVLDKEVEDDEELMRAIAASLEDGKGASRPPVIDDEPKPEKDSETSLNGEMIYPPLPEEPKSSRELCKIGIRLPDGRRIRRNFLPTDSTKVVDLIRILCPCYHSYLFTRLT